MLWTTSNVLEGRSQSASRASTSPYIKATGRVVSLLSSVVRWSVDRLSCHLAITNHFMVQTDSRHKRGRWTGTLNWELVRSPVEIEVENLSQINLRYKQILDTISTTEYESTYGTDRFLTQERQMDRDTEMEIGKVTGRKLKLKTYHKSTYGTNRFLT